MKIEFGTKSYEKSAQSQREAAVLGVTYYSDDHIPPSPYEPETGLTDNVLYPPKRIPLNDSSIQPLQSFIPAISNLNLQQLLGPK